MPYEKAGARALGENDRPLVDPRLSVLLRASAMFDLIRAGCRIDEAFDAVDRACHAIRPCHCEVATLQAWERSDQKIQQERPGKWRCRPADTPAWSRPERDQQTQRKSLAIRPFKKTARLALPLSSRARGSLVVFCRRII